MIVRSVRLSIAPMQAFELFTTRISDWWPPQSRHVRGSGSRLYLLPEGRFYEQGVDGEEFELGRVLEWEPGKRILCHFYVATGIERPTLVEIRFESEASGTRVTVTHGPTRASEAAWAGFAPKYDLNWGRVLAAYEGTASAMVRAFS